MQEDNKSSDKLEGVMEVLLELRQQAKAEKSFTYSDFIRQKLESAGIQLQDGKDSTTNYTITN